MKHKYTTLILLSLFIFPATVFGAVISVEPSSNNIPVGSVSVINLLLDTQGETINSIDGEVSFSADGAEFNIKDVNIGSSQFTVWLNPPKISSDKKTISFVGGIPGGINFPNVKIFSIAIEGIKIGEVQVNFTKKLVYKNDGKGTTTETSFIPAMFNIVPASSENKNEWSELIKGDTIPPNEFIIELGSDPSVFDGKKFISFQANDDHSGIDYYEVIEGNLPPIKATSPYILRNQNENEIIKVTAFDKNGNSRVSVYEGKTFPVKQTLVIFTVIIFALISYFIYNKRSKKIIHD